MRARARVATEGFPRILPEADATDANSLVTRKRTRARGNIGLDELC